MLLQGQDELLFEVEQSAAEDVITATCTVIESAGKPAVHIDVPLVVDAG